MENDSCVSGAARSESDADVGVALMPAVDGHPDWAMGDMTAGIVNGVGTRPGRLISKRFSSFRNVAKISHVQTTVSDHVEHRHQLFYWPVLQSVAVRIALKRPRWPT